MKFYAYCHNKTLEDNNGGSLVLAHHLHALEELGHESGGLLDLVEEVPEDADFIMFQGEWYDMIKKSLERSKAKRICWIGHFKTNPKYSMPKIQNIKADYFHTQYKGEAVEWGEKQVGQKIYYLPHAGCTKCNTEGKVIGNFDAVIIRNQFKERTEEWLEYANVKRMNAPFKDIKDIYKSSKVVANLHGDFQKGLITDFFNIPAYMINERPFQVFLSGGFCVGDNNKIVEEFFTKYEMPQAKDKEEYRDLIQYFQYDKDARIPFMEKAKKRILEEHTYTIRFKNFLETL